MGLTTAHFPSGDQIIARLYAIFILVHISLPFPLTMIIFDRSPSTSGGGHNRSFSLWGSHRFLSSATICAVFWVNLDYLPSHYRRSRVDRFTYTPSPVVVPVPGEDRTWSLTPVGVPVPNEDRTWSLTPVGVLVSGEDHTWSLTPVVVRVFSDDRVGDEGRQCGTRISTLL